MSLTSYVGACVYCVYRRRPTRLLNTHIYVCTSAVDDGVSIPDPILSLNLEHNQLTSFSGLLHLPNLKVLCLNHNKIERLCPIGEGAEGVLPSLQVLHLAYNQLGSLVPLQLHKMSTLRALFVQGVYIHTYVRTTYVSYMCVCTCVCMCTCMYVRMYVAVLACTYVYVYSYIYIYVRTMYN